mgnify:CR=1 FL=1
MSKVVITQIKSAIDRPKRQKATIEALGIKKLNVSVEKEACPLNLAPTASTTAALAMGDALAVALLDARGFKPEDFARSHPGGNLGRKLLTHVRDVMRGGSEAPRTNIKASITDALLEITSKRMGMTVVVDADRADAVLKAIKAAKHPAWIIGQITKGTGICRVE